MTAIISRIITLVVCLLVRASRGEEAGYNDDDQYYQYNNGDDDGGNAANDDGMQAYNSNYYANGQYGDGDDYIKYWTDYAILPKRCIVYDEIDVIVFSVHEHGYQKQCQDEPVGTYIVPVPYFMEGYLNEIEQETEEQGYDYEQPEVAQYLQCTAFVINNEQYYFQIGCADDTSQSLAVNIYEDNACSVRSVVDGYDDSNIDVSEIQVPFKKCKACVNWYDMNEDVDDQYYENHMTSAPFCSTAWAMKEECGRKCRHTGVEMDGMGWNPSDKILLAILSVFGLIMLGLIVRKRQKMSNKDALLEQAAMSAAGLQQPHVIGIFILVVLVIAVFALLGLKNITWALLLIINTALFGYLMKLTVDSGVSTSETVIGPDGTILRKDSDDSSCEDSTREPNRNAGTYMLPKIT